MEMMAKKSMLNTIPNTEKNASGRTPLQITIREPGSSLTHLAGMILALFGSIPLLIKGAVNGGTYELTALTIFMVSMILLYGASATYHGVNLSGERLKRFKKLDHMMIFVLIAGSYTPTCMLVLDRSVGYPLLIAVWSIAIVGMIFKFFWVTCPKWVSSVLYVAMGWVVLFAVHPLWQALSLPAFLWLLVGGIVYTAGGVIYALKLPIFNSIHKNFGSHEIFHLFVLGGSICHYVFTYFFVA